jgi:hypothetical protein
VLGPEAGALTGEAGAFSGEAEILTGEASGEHVNGGRVGSELAHIGVDGDSREALGEHGASGSIGLACPDELKPCSLKAKVEAAAA